MLAILKFFVLVTLFILAVSAVCGIIAFFRDIHQFKGEQNMSLPRAKLIQKIIEENELARSSAAEDSAAEDSAAEDKADEIIQQTINEINGGETIVEH